MFQEDHPVSPNHSYFQTIFEGADLLASFWQPMFKSVGRFHLEVAGLSVKQTQAALQLSRDLAKSLSPADVLAANTRYWEAVTAQCAVSGQRLSASITRAVELPPAFEVVKLPVKQPRDVIVIPDHAASYADRKVA